MVEPFSTRIQQIRRPGPRPGERRKRREDMLYQAGLNVAQQGLGTLAQGLVGSEGFRQLTTPDRMLREEAAKRAMERRYIGAQAGLAEAQTGAKPYETMALLYKEAVNPQMFEGGRNWRHREKEQGLWDRLMEQLEADGKKGRRGGGGYVQGPDGRWFSVEHLKRSRKTLKSFVASGDKNSEPVRSAREGLRKITNTLEGRRFSRRKATKYAKEQGLPAFAVTSVVALTRLSGPGTPGLSQAKEASVKAMGSQVHEVKLRGSGARVDLTTEEIHRIWSGEAIQRQTGTKDGKPVFITYGYSDFEGEPPKGANDGYVTSRKQIEKVASEYRRETEQAATAAREDAARLSEPATSGVPYTPPTGEPGKKTIRGGDPDTVRKKTKMVEAAWKNWPNLTDKRKRAAIAHRADLVRMKKELDKTLPTLQPHPSEAQ